MTILPPAIMTRLDLWLKALIRARSATIAFGPHRRADRVAEGSPGVQGLRDLLAASDSTVCDALPPRPVDRSGFVITSSHAAFLSRLVRAPCVERVLEFGAGYSTWVIACALGGRRGGSLTTVENSPEWCEAVLARAREVPSVDVRQVPGTMRLRLTPAGLVRAFPRLGPALGERGPFDLVFVDGPFWREGREGALHAALPHLRPGALIVLDDAGRPNERWVLERWLAACPGLRVELYDPDSAGKGIAVLRLEGSGEVAGTPGVVADSILLAAVLAVARALVRGRRWPRTEPLSTPL